MPRTRGPPWATGRPCAPRPAPPDTEPTGLCRLLASGCRGLGRRWHPAQGPASGRKHEQGREANQGRFCSLSFHFLKPEFREKQNEDLLSRAKTDLLLLSLGGNKRERGQGAGNSSALHVSLIILLLNQPRWYFLYSVKAKRKPCLLIAPTAAHR